jgi:predicted flap endonuclease-1-like 5' DNA nuclease
MIDRASRTFIAVCAIVAAVVVTLYNIVRERPLQDWLWVLLLILLAGLVGWWWAGRRHEDAGSSLVPTQTPQPRVREFVASEVRAQPPAAPVIAAPVEEVVVASFAAAAPEPVGETTPVVEMDTPEDHHETSPTPAEAPAISAQAEAPVVPEPEAAKPTTAKKPKDADSGAAKKPKAEKKTQAGRDDLQRIEGIGPKMKKALNAAGIETFQQLADASEDALRAAIEAQGMRFAPSLVTWARQARYLADGDEAGFQAYIERLVAGRDEG